MLLHNILCDVLHLYDLRWCTFTNVGMTETHTLVLWLLRLCLPPTPQTVAAATAAAVAAE
jgi:hypothetical protein